jgi:hypothetical protein
VPVFALLISMHRHQQTEAPNSSHELHWTLVREYQMSFVDLALGYLFFSLCIFYLTMDDIFLELNDTSCRKLYQHRVRRPSCLPFLLSAGSARESIKVQIYCYHGP